MSPLEENFFKTVSIKLNEKGDVKINRELGEDMQKPIELDDKAQQYLESKKVQYTAQRDAFSKDDDQFYFLTGKLNALNNMLRLS